MVVTHRNEFRGRKQKVGSVCFTDTGHLAFFIGYCPDPRCKGKVLIEPHEAREICAMFGKEQKKISQRVALRVLKKYANAEVYNY